MPATHATGEPATPHDRARVGIVWPPERIRAAARPVARVALVPLCAGIAVAVRRVVAADDLGDVAELALTAGAFVVVLAGFGLSLRLSRPGRSLARLAVPVGLVLVAAVFVARSLADISIEARSLGAAPDGPPSIIALGPDDTDVRFSGDIREGDAARLSALLDAHPAVRRIALTSDGGLADEGQALGAAIAAHRLSTYVPDYCASACTLAFAGGHERLALHDARIGFHAPYEEGLFGQTFAGDASGARAAYLAAGVAARFVDEAMAVAPGDMWYPEPERLIAAHVVTAFVDRAKLPDSNLDPDPTLAGARAVVLRNVPILSGLALAAPGLVDRIAGWYLEAYRHDWSEARVVDGLHALSDNAVALAAAGANDATLVDLARFAAGAMDAADPEECVAIGARGDLVAAAEVRGETDEAAVAKAAALVGTAMQAHAIPARVSSMPVTYRDAPDLGCAALRQVYRSALARPVPEAAALLRPRFAKWARHSGATLATAVSEP